MSIYSIYKATNKVNGMVYIGFDSHWPNRKKAHEYTSRSNSKHKKKGKLHEAMVIFGIDQFEWEVLYQSKDKDHTLNVMEAFFISEYDSCGPKGYNMTFGGEGCGGHTEEWKINHSNKMKGRKYSPEHVEKLRKIDRSYMKTESYRLAVSRAKKGKPRKAANFS